MSNAQARVNIIGFLDERFFNVSLSIAEKSHMNRVGSGGICPMHNFKLWGP